VFVVCLQSLSKISIYLSYCLMYSVTFIYSTVVISTMENPAGMGSRTMQANTVTACTYDACVMPPYML